MRGEQENDPDGEKNNSVTWVEKVALNGCFYQLPW